MEKSGSVFGDLDKNRIDADSRQELEGGTKTRLTPGKKKKWNLIHETESVSEEELPEDCKSLETEAISDGELRSAVISGAETVSDDELPLSNKRKSSKMIVNSANLIALDWESIHERVRTSRLLPELDKYWKVVKDDPSDFTGWTYLLQYVDQESDETAASDAYNSFLAMYPYCYGYWRKYADYEKRSGNVSKCEEVFKKGLSAIPLSVDLWLHYLNYALTTTTDDDQLRLQFESSVQKCGLEFRSDRLWMMYIQWELDHRRYAKVLPLYDRLLRVPIQNLKTHFDNFQDFVNRHRPNKILSVDEFFEIRAQVVHKIRTTSLTSTPPGDFEELTCSDEETVYMRERIVASRYKTYKTTMNKIAERWTFETSIKRPYFHIKPLEKSQLDNWMNYLDFEIKSGDALRAVVLFERALIACAMYPQFWLKYVKYLQGCSCDSDMIRRVYRRACLVHLPKNAQIALNWAAFEEMDGNLSLARKILARADDVAGGLLLVQLRRIHFERRCGNHNRVLRLFETYLRSTEQKCVAVALIAKYAQFCHKTLGDTPKAMAILENALRKHPDEPKFYFLLLELIGSTCVGFDVRYVDVFNRTLYNTALTLETKLQFAQMKLEYCQDHGNDLRPMVEAQEEYLRILQDYRELQVEKYKTEGIYYYSKRQ